MIWERIKGAFASFGAIVTPILPIIMIVIGLTGLAFGVFTFDPDGTNLAYREFSLAGSTAILAGGVFAATIKSLQIGGVFLQDLEKIVYSDRFLGIRTDLTNVWKRITRFLIEERFGDLSETVYENLSSSYLNPSRPYYFERTSRTLTIEPHLQDPSELHIEETVEVEVRPHKPGTDIEYQVRIKSTQPDGLTFDPTKWFVGEIPLARPDGESGPVTDYSKEGPDWLPEQEYYRHTITIPLPSKNARATPSGSFVIKRTSYKKVRLTEKPYIRYPNNNYVRDCEIIIHNNAPEIAVRIESLGTTGQFCQIGAADPTGHRLAKRYDGLMFPQQGYIVIFTRKRI